ncbi:Fur family ferric uptake transcriptional regulator [Fusobacterium naviforme]|uniref:Fur family ferric uptake transcriptional regulator n=1 Tax=Moryella indoligenes TaxID=371674 RepID=A0AAE3V9A9_9FIRM|nr:transcriptional repressor [Moryella indoligenes]KAB0578858.1 transcriptional repressor [Fusobacterium naviforme]MDQ0151878.1 Fur family ferric uptake transcriptional regulator [Moryella indoligenes]PSL11639.1 Fur family ferric uptake transcriptional regulator [Fusobacterium naviforme]STO26721.1 Ferric uptake regulation protein [Fusobacterium naviforme]
MPRSASYSTKARQGIMRCLEESSASTISVSDILGYLSERGLSVSPTTVYRYLDKLCLERRVIKYVAKKGEKAVYQLEREGQHCAEHLHLKCVHCGRVIHMDCGFMDEVEEHLKSGHGFRLQCEGSVLYGLCKDCAEKAQG